MGWTALERHHLSPFEVMDRDVTTLTGEVGPFDELTHIAHEHLVRPSTRSSLPQEARMSKIRLAIAGVGNCANSLIQGLEYYRDADPSDEVPGLMHVVLGGYHIRDIELV